MKLNTHDRTPRPKSNKFIKGLFVFFTILTYGLFGMISYVCFYEAQSFGGGIWMIIIPVLLTVTILFSIKDLEKPYVEIKENEIYVVDYYFGIKKAKRISFSDITSAEILPGSSFKVKGFRMQQNKYIVLKKDKKYLFKIICLPETEEIFKQYLHS